MESKGRKIKNGKEFDKLFPPPSEVDTTVKKDANVEDTMALIKRTVPQTLWQTKKIAGKLKGKTLEQTCSNIWHFVYNHIQYRKDEEGIEQVRSPRRTWWERESGVDCDCYTEFISSILLNLNIPHIARITKYPKPPPEIPRWQHVYPIVPKNRKLDSSLGRNDYIVLDCVKDDFDSEQPFEECKDYNMRLDYLDGVDQDDLQDDGAQDDMLLMGPGYSEPGNVDLADLAAVHGDEEMGKLFKKLKKSAKKVSSKAKKGLRFINRFTNPGTILLRNGFLLSMKLNLMGVAAKLRYAYLTDEQAKAMGVNINELKKLRKVKDRAETIYWQAGGKKENLKKAILSGKGNKDKKVPLKGLEGLDNVYADVGEYNIIHTSTEGLGELGVVASTSIAAATTAITALAAALKQVKGIFNKGGGGGEASVPAMDTQADQPAPADQPAQDSSSTYSEPAPASLEPSQAAQEEPSSFSQEDTSASSQDSSYQEDAGSEQPSPSEPSAEDDSGTDTSSMPEESVGKLSKLTSLFKRGTTAVAKQTSDTSLPAAKVKPQGFVQKTTTWVKANPGKSLLIAGTVVGAGFLLFKSLHSNKSSHQAMNGLQPGRRKKSKRKKHKPYKKTKVKRTNLF